MSKQSSIELFAIALYEKGFLKGNGDDINDLLEEAKAMHKEEIEYAYWEGGMDKPKGSKECEQYYNETFGGKSFQSSGTSNQIDRTITATNGGSNE